MTREIAARAGVAVSSYKEKCVQRRIAVRMRACGVHSYGEYLALLRGNAAEVERLTDALTINVTRFFRNVETWEAVRRTVLPALFASRRTLRVWSAGCSSGEEAYTVAMLAAELSAAASPARPLADLRIDATDIDRASMDQARQGCYAPQAVVDVPADLLVRYFTADATRYRVRDDLRARVQVARLDLTQLAPAPQSYDLIFCRNVLIYFDRDTQERLFQAFYDSLAPGGYLVLGKVETLFGRSRDRFALVETRERIYRRIV